MRLSLVFLMLILLPLGTGVHAWLFCRENLPLLSQEALRRLREAGVRDPVVELRFFDIAITGEAPDPAAREAALAAIRGMVPLRLLPEAERLHVTARIRAVVDGGGLRLSGWLPEGEEAENVVRLVAEMRPDLRLDTTRLHTAAEVRWPEGLRLPVGAASPWLQPLVAGLRVPAELRVDASGQEIVLSGLLPASALKEELVAALSEVAGAREVNPAALKASVHVLPAEFAKAEALAAFLREFFSAPPPRSFSILADGTPRLEGLATRQMESAWLALLRPVTGAARVDARLTLLPSVYHFPGHTAQSVVDEGVLREVREALKALRLVFDPGSARLSVEQQADLAALTPLLLSAGPGLRLVVGAHPDAAAQDGRSGISKARAQAVLSFLVEQGAPASDISALVFDPVPAGPSGASFVPGSVEILIK